MRRIKMISPDTVALATLFALFVMILLFGVLPTAGVAQSSPDLVIEPLLVDILADGGRSNFIVYFEAKADLSAAYQLTDWQARGRFVYSTLQEVARRTQSSVLAYAGRHGLQATSFLAANAVHIRSGDLQAALDIAALPGVEAVRRERTFPLWDAASLTLPDVRQSAASPTPQTVEWGIQDTQADQVWLTYDIRGAGSKVASIDTGVEWDHPALVNQFACPGDPTDPACWYDPSNTCGPGGACDNNGHGTHTTGTMVGDDGGVNQIGMAPEASWIACKGCESYSCSEFSLNACADWVLAPAGNPDNRPDVVNNAWGGMGGDPWFQSQVAAWRAAGIFPNFASGSSGPGCATLGSPGDYQESFGSTAHDDNRIVASFSSHGPSFFGHDPYTKPNLSAPGVYIRSAYLNGSYVVFSGVSMATSHSAGAVPLIVSACPALRWNVDALFDLLHHSADTPPPGNCGAPPDGEGNYTYGYGYLDVLAAVEECIQALHVSAIDLRARQQGSQYALRATVFVSDQAEVPAADALVTVEVTLPNNQVRTFSRTTNDVGQAIFSGRTRLTGEYTVCVTDIVKEGFIYAPARNVETCDSITVGSSIVPTNGSTLRLPVPNVRHPNPVRAAR